MGYEPETGSHPAEKEASADERLPYSIVVRVGNERERVIARAGSAQLAHAIFRAALTEHPNDRVLLRHEERVIADSAEA